MNTPLAITVIVQYTACFVLMLTALHIAARLFGVWSDWLTLSRVNSNIYWQHKPKSERDAFHQSCRQVAWDMVLYTIVFGGIVLAVFTIWPVAPMGA